MIIDDYGWIWFAKFESEFNIFRAPGSNALVNETVIGRRGGANSSWIQYVPTYVNGKKFKGWQVTENVTVYGVKMNVYKAIYE